MDIKSWVKENWCPQVLTLITVSGGVFMGICCARCLPDGQTKVSKTDTIYIKPSMTDSLLLDISSVLREVNEKLKPKKVYISKHRPMLDTLRIDASIHIDKP